MKGDLMKTKFGLMLLPLLCAVSVAMAQGVEKEGAADQPEAVAAPAEPAAIPARAEIIRCAETRRNK